MNGDIQGSPYKSGLTVLRLACRPRITNARTISTHVGLLPCCDKQLRVVLGTFMDLIIALLEITAWDQTITRTTGKYNLKLWKSRKTIIHVCISILSLRWRKAN